MGAISDLPRLPQLPAQPRQLDLGIKVLPGQVKRPPFLPSAEGTESSPSDPAARYKGIFQNATVLPNKFQRQPGGFVASLIFKKVDLLK